MSVKKQKKIINEIARSRRSDKGRQWVADVRWIERHCQGIRYNEITKKPIGGGRFKNIKEHIAEDIVNAALETIRSIYSQFENVQRLSNIGAELSKRVSFKSDYRYIVWGNYVVIYKAWKEYVKIYRVANRYQDITRIFEWEVAKWNASKIF